MRYSLAVILLFIQANLYAQDCAKVARLKMLMDQHHVQPRIWDEFFSIEIVDQLLYTLDPRGLYFLETERAELMSQTHDLHAQLLDRNCTFVPRVLKTYQNALDRSNRILSEIEEYQINFKVTDSLRLGFEMAIYPKDDYALRIRWLQQIRFDILKELGSKVSSDEELIAIQQSTLQKRCKHYQSIFARLQRESNESVILTKLMRAIVGCYDAHTQFFSKEELQLFKDQLSSEGLSYGIMLESDEIGNSTIGRIVPGSPAYNSRKINEGDVIISIGQPSKERIDATLYSSEELANVIQQQGNEINLEVRKMNGEEVTVHLTKEKIRLDENRIKSLVLGSEGHRVGYINLPVFYASDGSGGVGCAPAFGKEIILLKQHKIKGLILDLRSNGGGNMKEALDMAGLFVDRGALAIMKSKDGALTALKDANLGVAYDGPLIVLVDGGSASASELFVAAMRDHNRAVIVGTSTFGKGTAQQLFPFGVEGDFVKLTTDRFYGIKGNTHQGDGVVPDILLPDRFDALQYTERAKRHSLLGDFAEKKTYYTPNSPLPLEVLRDSSQARVARSRYFSNETRQKQNLMKYRTREYFAIPLRVTEFKKMVESLSQGVEEDQNTTPITVELTSFDRHVNAVDTFGRDTFDEFVGEVSHDPVVQEALNITIHYITIANKIK